MMRSKSLEELVQEMVTVCGTFDISMLNDAGKLEQFLSTVTSANAELQTEGVKLLEQLQATPEPDTFSDLDLAAVPAPAPAPAPAAAPAPASAPAPVSAPSPSTSPTNIVGVGESAVAGGAAEELAVQFMNQLPVHRQFKQGGNPARPIKTVADFIGKLPWEEGANLAVIDVENLHDWFVMVRRQGVTGQPSIVTVGQRKGKFTVANNNTVAAMLTPKGALKTPSIGVLPPKVADHTLARSLSIFHLPKEICQAVQLALYAYVQHRHAQAPKKHEVVDVHQPERRDMRDYQPDPSAVVTDVMQERRQTAEDDMDSGIVKRMVAPEDITRAGCGYMTASAQALITTGRFAPSAKEGATTTDRRAELRARFYSGKATRAQALVTFVSGLEPMKEAEGMQEIIVAVGQTDKETYLLEDAQALSTQLTELADLMRAKTEALAEDLRIHDQTTAIQGIYEDAQDGSLLTLANIMKDTAEGLNSDNPELRGMNAWITEMQDAVKAAAFAV